MGVFFEHADTYHEGTAIYYTILSHNLDVCGQTKIIEEAINQLRTYSYEFHVYTAMELAQPDHQFSDTSFHLSQEAMNIEIAQMTKIEELSLNKGWDSVYYGLTKEGYNKTLDKIGFDKTILDDFKGEKHYIEQSMRLSLLIEAKKEFQGLCDNPNSEALKEHQRIRQEKLKAELPYLIKTAEENQGFYLTDNEKVALFTVASLVLGFVVFKHYDDQDLARDWLRG